MICKFCNQNMKLRYIEFIQRNSIYCDNHKPVKVIYRTYKNNSSIMWIISYDDYVLQYWDDKTFLKKINRGEISSAKNYYQFIKKFDFELPIIPEQFPSKLETMLTFL